MFFLAFFTKDPYISPQYFNEESCYKYEVFEIYNLKKKMLTST